MTEIERLIEACNGEIRIKAARYEHGFYCLIAPYDVGNDVCDAWDDLTGGDNDYFEARGFFDKNDDVTLARGDSIVSALGLDMASAP